MTTQAMTKQMANTNGIASLLELLMMQVDLWRCETALGVGDDLYGDPLGYLGFHEHAFTLRATDDAGVKRVQRCAQYLSDDFCSLKLPSGAPVPPTFTGRLVKVCEVLGAGPEKRGMWGLFECLAYLNVSDANSQEDLSVSISRFRRVMGGKATMTNDTCDATMNFLTYLADLQRTTPPTSQARYAYQPIAAALATNVSRAVYHFVSSLSHALVNDAPSLAANSDVTLQATCLEDRLPVAKHWFQHPDWTTMQRDKASKDWTPVREADAAAARAWIKQFPDKDSVLSLDDDRWLPVQLFRLLLAHVHDAHDGSPPLHMAHPTVKDGPLARTDEGFGLFTITNKPNAAMLFLQALRMDEALLREHRPRVGQLIAELRLGESVAMENGMENSQRWEHAARQAEALRLRGINSDSSRFVAASTSAWLLPARSTSFTGVFLLEEPGAFRVHGIPATCVANFVDGSGTLPVFFQYKNDPNSALHMGSLTDVDESGDAACDVILEVLCDPSSPLHSPWREHYDVDDVVVTATPLRAEEQDLNSEICGLYVSVECIA